MIFDINMVEEGKLGFIVGRDGYFFSGCLVFIVLTVAVPSESCLQIEDEAPAAVAVIEQPWQSLVQTIVNVAGVLVGS